MQYTNCECNYRHVNAILYYYVHLSTEISCEYIYFAVVSPIVFHINNNNKSQFTGAISYPTCPFIRRLLVLIVHVAAVHIVQIKQCYIVETTATRTVFYPYSTLTVVIHCYGLSFYWIRMSFKHLRYCNMPMCTHT